MSNESVYAYYKGYKIEFMPSTELWKVDLGDRVVQDASLKVVQKAVREQERIEKTATPFWATMQEDSKKPKRVLIMNVHGRNHIVSYKLSEKGKTLKSDWRNDFYPDMPETYKQIALVEKLKKACSEAESLYYKEDSKLDRMKLDTDDIREKLGRE